MSSRAYEISQQFRFESRDIRRHCVDGRTWHAFVRTWEIETILALLADRRFARALEIGSGDGLQGERLANRCDELVCSDVDRRRWERRGESATPANVTHVLLDATDLTRYPDDTFDLVYSSNVLEHVEGIDRCLGEIRRVLKPSGIGIHSMPSRHWKIFNSLYRMSRLRTPRVHGTERTNWKEFVAFGVTEWTQKFDRAGLRVEHVYGMPFYLGAPGRWRAVVELGNRRGWPSSFAFFVRPGAGRR